MCKTLCNIIISVFVIGEIFLASIPTEAKDEPAQVNSIKSIIEPKIETTYEPEPEPEAWWTEEEYEMLCRMVNAEMGMDGIPDRAQQLTAMVAINRMRHKDFPDTIYEVIYAGRINDNRTIAYACVGNKLWKSEPPQRVKDNVLKALKGETECPEDIVWQAGFKQSAWNTKVKVYEQYKCPNGVTVYFCHYGIPY